MPQEKIIQDKRILICADDRQLSGFLKDFLKKEGYGQVDVSLSGEEVMEKLAKARYQLVLLGISSAGRDGLQTLRRIKEFDTNIAVIMIVDSLHIEAAEEAVKMGAYDYILEPVDLDNLKLVILTKLLIDS